MARTAVHKPLRVFCSYSHKDEEHLNVLREWLRGLERQGFIEWWHDRAISPGWEWEEAIDKNLRTADIILLLVSPDFMASDYVFEKEIDRAIERHERGEACVIPIIVRPADWEWASFGKLQALPKDAKPITTWPNQDEAWLDVARGVRKAVEELLVERQERAARERAREEHLKRLYGRARTLHQDQKWQTVINIFDQIHAEDPAYPDPEGLLSSAHEALEAQERVQRVAAMHGQELRHMQAEEWHQALANPTISLANIDQLRPLRTLKGHKAILSLAFSPDGRLLASGWRDKKVRLWRVEDGALIREMEHEGTLSYVVSLTFSPDGSLLASGASGVRIWQAEDGTLFRKIEYEGASAVQVAFSPKGQVLASSGTDNRVRLWQVEDGALLRTLEEGPTGVLSLAFSPDGRLLASGDTYDTGIVLWRMEDGTRLRTLEGHEKKRMKLTARRMRTIAHQGAFLALVGGPLAAMVAMGGVKVAFSPDGSLLASGALDAKVILWRMEDGTRLRTLEGHEDLINSVAFSPDGRLLASGSDNGRTILWRVEDGTRLDTLEHNNSVDCVAFSPDGRVLASGVADETVVLWGMP